MKQILPLYKCTQQQLYAITRLGWDFCRQQLTQFAAFKPKYTQAFINDQLTALDAAAAMPNEQSRNEVRTNIRVLLTRSVVLNLANWQTLKTYIIDSFDEDLRQIQLNVAGAAFYEKACNTSWSDISSLLTTASQFINDHKTFMIFANIMPSGFPQIFNDHKAH